jgi:hypothetical protein
MGGYKLMTQWAVVISQTFYPSIQQFDTYEEAYKEYLYECNMRNTELYKTEAEVMLVKIEKRRKYHK